MSEAREMPQYRSYKVVGALEIASVAPSDDIHHSRRVTFKEEGFAPRDLPGSMFVRYTPVPGDFLVQYNDGYLSFSPRAAFLEGYTPVGQSFAQIKQGLKDQK